VCGAMRGARGGPVRAVEQVQVEEQEDGCMAGEGLVAEAEEEEGGAEIFSWAWTVAQAA
jgi:hypothetical protein